MRSHNILAALALATAALPLLADRAIGADREWNHAQVNAVSVSWTTAKSLLEIRVVQRSFSSPFGATPSEQQIPFVPQSYFLNLEAAMMGNGDAVMGFNPKKVGVIRPSIDKIQRYLEKAVGETPTSFTWYRKEPALVEVATKKGLRRITVVENKAVYAAIEAVKDICLESIAWWIISGNQ